MSSNPPQGYPVTRAQPDDNKNQQYWTGLQAVLAVLARGVPRAVRTLTSLRVGSGSATLAAIDGTDGIVMADGVTAGFLTRDRDDSTKRGVFKRKTNIIIGTEAGDLIQIDPTTGFVSLVTSGAWTAVLGGIGFTNSWTNNALSRQVAGYRLDILGRVELRGAIVGGAAGSSAFTLPTGFRPLGTEGFAALYYNGATWATMAVEVDTAGHVMPETAVAAGGMVSLSGITFGTT